MPQPSWSPSTTQQLRKLVAAPYLSPNDWTPRSNAYFASPLALCARRVSSAASRLLGTTSLRFALHGWQQKHGDAGKRHCDDDTDDQHPLDPERQMPRGIQRRKPAVGQPVVNRLLVLLVSSQVPVYGVQDRLAAGTRRIVQQRGAHQYAGFLQTVIRGVFSAEIGIDQAGIDPAYFHQAKHIIE
ncbi:hypothetical protein, partial [Thiolapillus sp.]